MLVHSEDTPKHRVHIRPEQIGDLITRPAIMHALSTDVGDLVRASHLIENIYFMVPIAQLTLRDLPSGDTALLDGVWRLSVLKTFVDGGFPLAGMDYWPELNGKRFAELPHSIFRRRIVETRIQCIVLDIRMSDEMCVRYLQQIRS